MYYLLAVALILRLILINQSLWLDESIQALALMGRLGPILTYALADFQPPLYHGLLWLWTRLAGFSELSLRFPSLLAGLGTVYFLAQLGHYLGGKKLGVITGLLAATNPLLIYYSQEGRTYSLTAFLVTAAIYYFVTSLKNPTKKSLLLYGVFSTLFLWTSYLAWFLHLIVFLYTLTQKRWVLLKIQLISALTLIFWLPSLYQSLQVGLSTVSNSPEWGRVVGGISVKALALTWVKAVIGRISIDPPWVYGLVVSSLFLLHLRVLAVIKKPPAPILVWLGSIPVLALVSLLLPVYSYTRLLFVVPAYLLLLALGLNRLSKLWTSLLVSLQLLFVFVFWFNPTFHREAWRSVVTEYGTDAHYALPSRNQSAPLLYYGVKEENILEPKLGLPPDELASSIIYLKYVENVFDPTQIGLSHLRDSGYQLRSQRVYPGLQIELYENHN